MSHVLIFSGRNPRALMLLMTIFAVGIILAAGSALRGNIADLFAGNPTETAAYPGSVSYDNAIKGLFGCELEEVNYHSFHTADAIDKVVAFYQQRGFAVVRDDSIKTCCISKMSFVLSSRQKRPTMYVTLEKPWFAGRRFMNDTLIVVAFAQKPQTAALQAKR